MNDIFTSANDAFVMARELAARIGSGDYSNREFLLCKLAHGSLMALDALGIEARYAKELPIIYAGPGHRLWLSARLLLGLSEDEAMMIHKERSCLTAVLA